MLSCNVVLGKPHNKIYWIFNGRTNKVRLHPSPLTLDLSVSYFSQAYFRFFLCKTYLTGSGGLTAPPLPLRGSTTKKLYTFSASSLQIQTCCTKLPNTLFLQKCPWENWQVNFAHGYQLRENRSKF